MPDPKIKPDLPEAIRLLRGDVSQQAFATELGISVASVSRYERGSEPDATALGKFLAKADQMENAELSEIFEEQIEKRYADAARRFKINVAMRLPEFRPLVEKRLARLKEKSEKYSSEDLESFLAKAEIGAGREEKLFEENRDVYILAAVGEFLIDPKTTDREKRILEELVSEHLNALRWRRKPAKSADVTSEAEPSRDPGIETTR